MNIQELQKSRAKIFDCLDRREINQAIELLTAHIDQAGTWSLRESLQQTKMSYGLMLQYLAKGILDPERDDVLSHIVNTLGTLTDQCFIALQEKESSEVFFARRRELGEVTLAELVRQYRTQLNKLSLLKSVGEQQRDRDALLQVLKSCEQWQTSIFNKIWSTFPTPQGDAEIMASLITDDDIPEPMRCLVVMALLLSLMRLYDETKLTLLSDAYTHSSSIEVQVRAIVGVLLGLNSHRQRATHSRSLGSHLLAMSEVRSFADDMAMVIYRLIGTRNTDQVMRRVTQDIIPDIIKASPNMMRKMRDRNADLDPADLEGNPEWQQMLEDSGLANKLEEFTQLQLEGSDVFISTFSRLKTFPFFNTLSNWFLPYHSEHSTVVESFGENEQQLRQMIEHAPFLCNSDRYSFCLSLRSVPESQRQMIIAQSQQQMADLKEVQSNQDMATQQSMQRDTVATRCVQDLYRFFKLYSRRHEFTAAMDTDMDFTTLPFLSEYTNDENTLRLIAEFYLKNGFDQDAIKYFSHLLEVQHEADPIVFQKLGFAHERMGNLRQALQQYQRHELANDKDLWTLRHIASCYRSLKKADKAMEYYRRIDAIKPGQMANTLNMGHTLLESGKVEEALKCYFKADLMNDSRHRAWRPIAWASFLLGNDERSMDYYNRIVTDDSPTMSDYLNRGHVNLCAGRIAEAISDYRQAATSADTDSFRQAMLADLDTLTQRGIQPNDVYLAMEAATTT